MIKEQIFFFAFWRKKIANVFLTYKNIVFPRSSSRIMGCGESIKDFFTLVFWGSILGVLVFVTSDDLINRGYKTESV